MLRARSVPPRREGRVAGGAGLVYGRRRMAAEYHAFISYSHAADDARAAALQRALQAIGKPWWRRSTIKVFRDKTSLAASPGLWPEIERNLERSRCFVLMASEAAAASPWVRKEVAWWLQHRSAQTLLIVVTAGTLAWDAQAGDFDPAHSTAIPPDLFGVFRDEPLYVDLRWASTREQTSLRHARFRDAALTLAAVLHGRPKDELDSDEIRQHRRQRVAMGAGLVAVGAFAVLAAIGFQNARSQAERAETNWRESQSRRLATLALEHLDGDHDLALAMQYAVLAWRLSRTEQAEGAMRRIVQSTGAVAQVLDRHGGDITALAFSPDSQTLASASRDGAILLWPTQHGVHSSRVLVAAPAAAKPQQQQDVDELVFDPGGSHLLALNGKGRLDLWNVGSAQVQHYQAPLQGSSTLYAVALAAGGQRVALAGDAFLAIWIPASGTLLRAPLPPSVQFSRVYGVRFEGDDRVLALVTDGYVSGGLRLLSWDTSRGAVRVGKVAVYESPAHVTPVFAPDGKHLLLWGDERPALWSYGSDLALSASLPLTDAPDHQRHLWVTASFDVDGQGLWLATERSESGGGGSAQWQSWRLTPSLHRLAQGEIVGMKPVRSPDGRWVAAITRGGGALSDLQRPAAAASAIAPGCDREGDACAVSLCEKVSTQLGVEELRRLFGIADYEVFYETYKSVVDRSICRGR
jgi:hypothetical protein